MRPIGGMITGTQGDIKGRKTALVTSMLMMAVPTFAMGCLPSYEQVGWISTALLVLCRLLQGLSVGGQLPSSLVFTVERQPREHWGYYGSLVVVSCCMRVHVSRFFPHLYSHRKESIYAHLTKVCNRDWGFTGKPCGSNYEKCPNRRTTCSMGLANTIP